MREEIEVKRVTEAKAFIVWRLLLPLARKIDRDKDDDEPSYVEILKRKMSEIAKEE